MIILRRAFCLESKRTSFLLFRQIFFFLFFSSYYSYAQVPPGPVLERLASSVATGGSIQTSLSGIPAGSLLVYTVAQKDDAARPNASVSSSPSLTWTKRVDAQSTGSGNAEIYTAILPSGGTITVTAKWSAGGISASLYAISNYDASAFIGSNTAAVNQSSPSVTLSTTRDASFLIAVTSDRNRVSGSPRAYRDGAVETNYHFVSKAYTAYHYYKTTALSGSYTTGISNPTGMNAGTAVLEIKPVIFVAPVANAGSNQTITLPTNSVTLSGTASTGTITSYVWRQVSGPNAATLATPNASSTTASGLTYGTYVFELSLNGGYTTSQVTVTVNPEPVVANAGVNQSIILPLSSVTLSGAASTGTILSYAWTQSSGPNSATLATPTSATTTASGLIQGTYTFILSLNEGASTDQVTITVNPAPVANAGNDQTITLPVSSVTLSGSASAGTINSYLWSQIAGPNTAALVTPSAVSTTASGLIAGTYSFRLSLNGGASMDTVRITVNPAPTANAGSNQTIILPANSVTLNGSGSTGVITSYLWTQVSGPNTASLATPTSVSTTASGLIQGTYIFNLSVNSGVSNSQVTITVGPAPVANAGADQSIILPVSSVTLSGNSSTGTITSYAWTQVAGPNTATLGTPNTVSTTASGLVVGTYSFRLSLNGGTSSDTVNILVSPAPVANAGSDQTITLPVNSVTLSGSASSGTIISYAWTQLAGPNTAGIGSPTTVSTTVSGLIAGTYSFRLSLNGGTSNDTVRVIVNPAPTANAGSNQTIILPTNSVTLNGSGSSGVITSYLWTQVSGPNTAVLATPTAASTTATGLVQGSYVFNLSINGGVSNSQVTITVSPAPVANAGVDKTITLPVSSVTLSGSASTGTITSYLWTQLSGPNTATLAGQTTVTATASGLIAGTYSFRLSLNSGASMDTVRVVVNPAPVANAGTNQTITLPTNSVTLNGSGSTGTITSYQWSQVSGPNTATLATPTAVSTTASGLVQGQYVFRLSLNGGTSTSDVTVTVQPSTITNTNYTVFTTQTPPSSVSNDGIGGIQLGMKFRSTTTGSVTGIRFYKASGNTGTHTGELYNASGQRLASAVFTSETSSGWQEVYFTTPVAISANVTYVASMHSASGNYTESDGYFSSAVTNGPLTGLANGTDGANGLYLYTNAPAFPSQSYQSTNYWVDVIFNTSSSGGGGGGGTSLSVSAVNPQAEYVGVSISSSISATFSKSLNATTVNSQTVILQAADGTTVSAGVTYNSTNRTITVTPSSSLQYYTIYSVTLKGGSSSPKILDIDGIGLSSDYSWRFLTESNVNVSTDPNAGPGGPVLVITSSSNPFTKYTAEILRAEGMNAFATADIGSVTSTLLNNYDVAILGEMALTSTQVTTLTNWVTAGGKLICFRPDAQLSSLLGVNMLSGSLDNKYLLVNTISGPGVGIVNKTIQYHGSAKLFSLNGASTLATLYSAASTATSYPAVTERSVGTSGGKAYAFAYDLPRSVVYTRQGNPAWAGQERDGMVNIRASDMFYPDWIDLNKVDIPQADEQQHLLANIIIKGNLNKKPLPRFWILPGKLKAAVVMTGDDHATGGTPGRFNQYLGFGNNTAQDILDWKAIRGSSYLFSGYPTSTLSNDQAAKYNAQGFDLGVHLNTACGPYDQSTLQSYFNSQLSELKNRYPGIPNTSTHRTHCISWSDWASKPKVEKSLGIRLNTDYYYWPGAWIQDRPGVFTGSGMPMRHADLDGTIIDNYQVVTQLTDESGISYSYHISSLLDKALGADGYYGVFCANMHTDVNGGNSSNGSDIIISAARSRNVPVITSRQLLTWLDGRNNSAFSNIAWNGNVLTFNVTTASGAYKLQGMVPVSAANGQLLGITMNGVSISYTTETIKGINYAFFQAGSGSYAATYSTGALQVNQMESSKEEEYIGKGYALGQNYPNPFSGSTRITYSVPQREQVAITLHDVQGRRVKVIEQKMAETGTHEVVIDATKLQAGVYYYRMQAGGNVLSRKLVVR